MFYDFLFLMYVFKCVKIKRNYMFLFRKRILDFYHRSSLTAHCMGYAYSPLNNNILTKDFYDMYIELPAEGYNLFSSLEVATSSPR